MENQVSIKSLGLKWGLILGLMSTILGLVVNMMNLYDNSGAVQVVSLILVLGALILALKEFKSGHEGFMNFGEGFGLSMLILAISAVFSNIISYIYMKFIDTGIIERIKETQIIQMEEQGLSDEQIDMAMEYSEFFMTPEMITISGFFAYLFFGALIALVISAILKNKRPVEL